MYAEDQRASAFIGRQPRTALQALRGFAWFKQFGPHICHFLRAGDRKAAAFCWHHQLCGDCRFTLKATLQDRIEKKAGRTVTARKGVGEDAIQGWVTSLGIFVTPTIENRSYGCPKDRASVVRGHVSRRRGDGLIPERHANVRRPGCIYAETVKAA